MLKSKFILIFGIICGICFGFRAEAEEKPLISQVQITGGTGHTADDFVEIFNPNDAPFNLKDYRLVKRTKTGNSDTSLKSWTSDTYIPARSFFLWANSGFTAISSVPDIATTGTIANDNGVGLRQGAEDTGILADSVAWGGSSNGFRVVSSQNPGANEALYRTNLHNPVSEFTIGASSPKNSSISETGAPAPSPAPSSNPAAEAKVNDAPPYEVKSLFVKLSEILPDPEGEDSGQEAVEIYNSGQIAADLDGWYIHDKNSGSLEASAWQISQITIDPGEYLVLTIPKNKFSLNNIGGDAVNLYFADKTLADSVSYSDDTKENLSFQKFQSTWIWSAPSLGKENFGQTAQAAAAGQIFVNEIFSNPEGADEGKEWVEIANTSNSSVNLKGFALDNGTDDQSLLKNALTLDEKAMLLPNGFLQVKLPEDKFLFANGGDALRFFDQAGKILEAVNIPLAPEGRSYSKNSQGKWEFALPTPKQANAQQFVTGQFVISEFLPSPGTDQDEFVELRNVSTSTEANLSGLVLQIGSRSLKLSSQKIGAGEFYLVLGDDLPGHLPNAGGQVSLADANGGVMSKIDYTQAKVGQSFALTPGGEYIWSKSPTPGQANELVLGESVVATAASEEKQTAAAEKKTEKKLASENIELKRDILDLSNQVALLTQKIEGLSVNLDSKNSEPLATLSIDPGQSGQAAKPLSSTKYLFASGLALVCLIAIGFKYAKNVL